MISENKTKLRKLLISDRKQMSKEVKETADVKVFDFLVSSEKFAECENLLCYVSTEIEVDTIRIIEYSLRNGKNVFVPKCASKGNAMTFHRISSLDSLVEGMYGILEPDESLLPFDGNDKKNTVCIVPALSYNELGMRLGYGKGYYDRFLSENEKVYPIGLCYSKFIRNDIPTDKHDKPVKMIITEERIIKTEV